MEAWIFGTKISNSHHLPQIINTGWGEPPEYHSSCSCGWRGIVIDSWRLESNYIDALREPYKSFVIKWGIDTYNSLSNTASGDYESALIQVLHHIGYDPQTDAENVINVFDNAVTVLRNSENFHDASLAAKNVKLAADELADQKMREQAWETVELPQKIEVDERARKEYLDVFRS